MKQLNTIHPAVAALYFLSVLAVTVFSGFPCLQAVSLVSGMLFCFIAEGGRKFIKSASTCFLLFIIVALTNPLFVHNGASPLFFMNDNAVTLESVLNGVYIAAMLLSAIFWFRGFNFIMTSEKLLYLFGKFSPKISLLLSSALRFVPLFKIQAQKIKTAQAAMGISKSESIPDRFKAALSMYSALITWALENAVDTGASMKARGYGLCGRTYFALFRFKAKDAAMLIYIFILDAVVFIAGLSGALSFSFYPRITANINGLTVAAVCAFFLLAFLPIILEGEEAVRWRYYRSKI